MGKFRVFSLVMVLILGLALTAANAVAAPLRTNIMGLDGLFYATGGSTIPQGQLAAGASMRIISDNNIDGSALPVSVTYGATSDIELAAAFETVKHYDDSGMGGPNDDTGTGDMYLSGKFALQDETPDYPATAVGVRIKLPMADAPLSSEKTDFSVFAAMEMSMKSVKALVNVEYILPGGDDENQVKYIMGLKIPYSDTTDFSVELVHQPLFIYQPLRGDILNAGATFDLGSAVNFGLGVGMGLNDNLSSDFTAQGKLTFTF